MSRDSAGRGAVRCAIALLALVAAISWPVPSAAAQGQTRSTLRVYLDCRVCDFDFLRQDVGFVQYVRDRSSADIHVLVLTETTGGGGRVWTLMFIGYDRFRGQNRTLEFATLPTDSRDDERREFSRVFRLGLVGYAAGLPILDQLDVTWRSADAAAGREVVADRDGWDHWVFRIDAGGDLSGEHRSRQESFRYAVSASRVTEAWKLNVSAQQQRDQRRFEFEGEPAFESTNDGWRGEALLVRSIGSHWAAGTRLSMSQSSYANTDRSESARAGIEVDVFPYAESSRRSLTIQYAMGADRLRYRELTIFDKLEETVAMHEVDISAGFRQPWGALTARGTFAQQIEYRDRYRATVWGATDVQVGAGFAVTFFGEYSRIRDQISLPKAGASREEVLLRLQELGTSYSYVAGLGISYSFGSVFNSVVNPRFRR